MKGIGPDGIAEQGMTPNRRAMVRTTVQQAYEKRREKKERRWWWFVDELEVEKSRLSKSWWAEGRADGKAVSEEKLTRQSSHPSAATHTPTPHTLHRVITPPSPLSHHGQPPTAIQVPFQDAQRCAHDQEDDLQEGDHQRTQGARRQLGQEEDRPPKVSSLHLVAWSARCIRIVGVDARWLGWRYGKGESC